MGVDTPHEDTQVFIDIGGHGRLFSQEQAGLLGLLGHGVRECREVEAVVGVEDRREGQGLALERSRIQDDSAGGFQADALCYGLNTLEQAEEQYQQLRFHPVKILLFKRLAQRTKALNLSANTEP